MEWVTAWVMAWAWVMADLTRMAEVGEIPMVWDTVRAMATVLSLRITGTVGMAVTAVGTMEMADGTTETVGGLERAATTASEVSRVARGHRS